MLRLKLRALGLDATVGQRIEAGLGGLDQRLGAGDLGLQRGLLSRRAAALQQVELALGGLDRGVARVDGGARGGLGSVARVAVRLLVRLAGDRADQRRAHASGFLLERGLVGFGGRCCAWACASAAWAWAIDAWVGLLAWLSAACAALSCACAWSYAVCAAWMSAALELVWLSSAALVEVDHGLRGGDLRLERVNRALQALQVGRRRPAERGVGGFAEATWAVSTFTALAAAWRTSSVAPFWSSASFCCAASSAGLRLRRPPPADRRSASG